MSIRRPHGNGKRSGKKVKDVTTRRSKCMSTPHSHSPSVLRLLRHCVATPHWTCTARAPPRTKEVPGAQHRASALRSFSCAVQVCLPCETSIPHPSIHPSVALALSPQSVSSSSSSSSSSPPSIGSCSPDSLSVAAPVCKHTSQTKPTHACNTDTLVHERATVHFTESLSVRTTATTVN